MVAKLTCRTLLTLATLIGICVLQLGILIAVSQLALHAGIAALVLLTPPILSRIRRPDFTLTLAARPPQLTFVGGTLLFLVGLAPFR